MGPRRPSSPVPSSTPKRHLFHATSKTVTRYLCPSGFVRVALDIADPVLSPSTLLVRAQDEKLSIQKSTSPARARAHTGDLLGDNTIPPYRICRVKKRSAGQVGHPPANGANHVDLSRVRIRARCCWREAVDETNSGGTYLLPPLWEVPSYCNAHRLWTSEMTPWLYGRRIQYSHGMDRFAFVQLERATHCAGSFGSWGGKRHGWLTCR